MRWCRNIIAYSETLRVSVPCKLWVNEQCLHELNWVYCSSFLNAKVMILKTVKNGFGCLIIKKIFIINKILNLH